MLEMYSLEGDGLTPKLYVFYVVILLGVSIPVLNPQLFTIPLLIMRVSIFYLHNTADVNAHILFTLILTLRILNRDGSKNCKESIYTEALLMLICSSQSVRYEVTLVSTQALYSAALTT